MTYKYIDSNYTLISIDDIIINGVRTEGVPYPDYGIITNEINGILINKDEGQLTLIKLVNDGKQHLIKIECLNTDLVFKLMAKVSRFKICDCEGILSFVAYLDEVVYIT